MTTKQKIKQMKDRIADLEQIIELKEKVAELERKLSSKVYPYYHVYPTYPYYRVYPKYPYVISCGGSTTNTGTFSISNSIDCQTASSGLAITN